MADTSAKHIKSRTVATAMQIVWAASKIIRVFPDIQERRECDRDPAWGLKTHRRRKSYGGLVSADFCFLDSRVALAVEKASNSGVVIK